MTDAELIKESRKMFGMDKKQFAALINFSEGAIHSWELGRREPRAETFRVILNAIVKREMNRAASASSRQAFINDTVEKLKAKE